jgi:glycosyltransferase involved in cell wall biosynthesis
MYKGKNIGVVVPAYNEEKFIISVIRSVPDFVDKIFIVNDHSSDNTRDLVVSESAHNNRVIFINREKRGGVGAAIISGHRTALQAGMDIMAVMAGDGQMDPFFLTNIIKPIIDGRAEYVKGNRLSSSQHRKDMPLFRYIGNFLLTNFSRISTGYYNISDPQNGYTAIAANTLRKLDLDNIERGYAFENDMLIRLNCIRARVVDVPHPAVYQGKHSKIRYPQFIVRTSWILFSGYFRRLWMKYVIKH